MTKLKNNEKIYGFVLGEEDGKEVLKLDVQGCVPQEYILPVSNKPTKPTYCFPVFPVLLNQFYIVDK